VAAIVSSGIVIWGRTTRGSGKDLLTAPLFSKAHRRTAAIALSVSVVLLILFLVQVGVALSRPSGLGRFAINPSTPGSGARAARATSTPAAAPPAAGASASSVPPPAVTPTGLPAAPSPVVEAATLVSQGFAALSTQNYAQALSLFDRALQSDATNARAQLGLGETYYYLANYRAAVPPLRLALELNPDLNEAHAYLGFAYDDTQDSVRARAEYEEYLRVAPSDFPLRAQVETRLQANRAPSPTAGPTLRSTAPPTQPPVGN
jgi:hypothetical protein